MDLAMEELYLFPPIRTEVEMKKLRDFVLAHIVHPIKRQIVEKEARELIQKALNAYA
jgi:hypothetical protein